MRARNRGRAHHSRSNGSIHCGSSARGDRATAHQCAPTAHRSCDCARVAQRPALMQRPALPNNPRCSTTRAAQQPAPPNHLRFATSAADQQRSAPSDQRRRQRREQRSLTVVCASRKHCRCSLVNRSVRRRVSRAAATEAAALDEHNVASTRWGAAEAAACSTAARPTTTVGSPLGGARELAGN